MELRFSLTVDDWIAYNHHHWTRSGYYQRVLLCGLLLGALIFAAMAVVPIGPLVARVGIAVIATIAFFFLYRIAYWRRTNSYWRQVISAGRNKHLFGEQTLSVHDDGVSQITEVSKTETSWDGVERLEEGENYFFVYIGAIQAYIVPKRAFAGESEQKEFFDAFGTHVTTVEYEPSNNFLSAPPKETGSSSFTSGFLGGSGFFFALLCGLLLVGFVMKIVDDLEEHEHERAEQWSYQAFSADSKVEIVSHREVRTEYNSVVLGTLRNNGEAAWIGLTLETDYYDADGQFVDKCTAYLAGALEPGAERNFKINCAGSEKEPVSEYARYEVRVVDAHHRYSD